MLDSFEIIKQGGWPMIALAICSFVGITIIIERLIALRRKAVIDPRVSDALDTFNGADLEAVCQNAQGPFAALTLHILQHRHLPHAQAIDTMNAAGRTQISKLERGLTLLEIIAGISPLIGLLGTVLGMVEVFNAISQQGLGNPQVLSSGISQALVTTIGGLTVAIPALAFYSILSKRIEQYAIEMQERGTNLVTQLQSQSAQLSVQAAPPPQT